MTQKRVLITRRLPDSVMEQAAVAYDLETRDSEIPLTEAEAKRALGEFDGVLTTLGDGFTANAFESSRPLKCRILANFGVGYNHIDIAAAEWHGIAVTNTPGTVTESTADIALALILATARRVVEGDKLVRAGKWVGWQPTQMLGHAVSGKTVGIIGMGRIGQAVAKRCHFGFDMKVVYATRSPITDLEFTATAMDSPKAAMQVADFVVVTVSANPSTHHLINAELIDAMQSHAILINVSRGDTVDESSLVEALEKQQIAGAGLDVYEFEPQVPPRLTALSNVVLLPHLGTSVLPTREAMGFMALDNLNAFFAGKSPPNRV